MPHTKLEPTFQDVSPVWRGMPNTRGWYFTSVVSGVSEEALPWMLAQGWHVNGVNIDDTVKPPITTYLMSRTKLLHWNMLRSLMFEFNQAFNEGRAANDKRYEDVVWAWQKVLDKHQQEMTEFQTDKVQDESVGYVTLMFN